MFFAVAEGVAFSVSEFRIAVEGAAVVGVGSVDVEIFPVDDFGDGAQGEMDVGVELLLLKHNGVFDPVVLNSDESDESRTDDHHQDVDEPSFHFAAL